MRNNSTPARRKRIRAMVDVSAAAMARWPLLKIISDGMKPTGEYSSETVARYRSAVRAFQRTVGFEQSAVNVTARKLAAFHAWLRAEGYEPRTVKLQLDCLAAVVRFADEDLLPSRGERERMLFADAAIEGTLEHFVQTEYFPVNTDITTEATREMYGSAIGNLSDFLGRPAALADLTDDTFRRWMDWMELSGRRLSTINSYMTTVRAFWRWAARRRIVNVAPTIGKLRSLRAQAPAKKAKPKVAPSPPPKVVKRRSPAERKGRQDLGAPNSIARFVVRYLRSREVCREYAYILNKIASKFAQFSGAAAIDDLFNEDLVNEFLASRRLSKWTVRNYRGIILSLWNAAADEDLVPYPRVRRIKLPKRPQIVVECFTIDQVRQLLGAAQTFAGEYPNGVSRNVYWKAAILLAWDTGLRRGDVWLFFAKAWFDQTEPFESSNTKRGRSSTFGFGRIRSKL